ncbi:MAG: hypothetical protein IPM59_14010 [Chloracidobacterium sp.]|nr:hypothetical protein [Chloracidobacterium sp.]
MRRDENNFDEVGKLLGTLGRVDPPGDFDVRVRARIAAGIPARRSLLPFARIAVPAALLLAVGGYFGYTSFFAPADVPPVAETRAAPDSQPQLPSMPPDNTLAVRPDEVAVRAPSPNNSLSTLPGPKTPEAVRPSDEQGGGSLDFSFPTARRRLPRGLDPDRVITDANIGSDARLSAATVMGMLGISAACSASGCRVRAVSPNSIAANSGVVAGDVIEAVDGTALNAGTSFSGQFSAANVRVRRNGSTMTISLRP